MIPSVQTILAPIEAAVAAVAPRLAGHPPAGLALVTGSGLGGLAAMGEVLVEIPYEAIPGLGGGQVAGHAGMLRLLAVDGRTLLCMVGRRHLYEGIDPATAALGVRLLARLGVEQVILTNAAGGLTPALWPGDLMRIDDHINLMMRNPLIGPHVPQLGPRFPDFSAPYDPALARRLRAAALDAQIALHEGVYVGLTGPNYETRAEVRMLRRLGADAVGMSTVPEVLAAVPAGLRLAALSLITNSHVHPAPPPTHDEVLAMAAGATSRIARLVRGLLREH